MLKKTKIIHHGWRKFWIYLSKLALKYTWIIQHKILTFSIIIFLNISFFSDFAFKSRLFLDFSVCGHATYTKWKNSLICTLWKEHLFYHWLTIICFKIHLLPGVCFIEFTISISLKCWQHKKEIRNKNLYDPNGHRNFGN